MSNGDDNFWVARREELLSQASWYSLWYHQIKQQAYLNSFPKRNLNQVLNPPSVLDMLPSKEVIATAPPLELEFLEEIDIQCLLIEELEFNDDFDHDFEDEIFEEFSEEELLDEELLPEYEISDSIAISPPEIISPQSHRSVSLMIDRLRQIEWFGDIEELSNKELSDEETDL